MHGETRTLIPSFSPFQAYERDHHPDASSEAIVVLDVNDVNEPPSFLSNYYSIAVSENAELGTILLTAVTALDLDEVCEHVHACINTFSESS